MTKYLLYARKSTDEDDRQVLSIQSQLTELRQLAAREGLEIAEEFVESRTAKDPGRPLFNQMIAKLESGLGGYGILAWHPDRLARNSVDGGKVIYLVDTGKISALKFPTFWFDNTPQGKFMLNIAFGQSKYYVDNLSENVHRGLRQKLRRGEFPGMAPIGYLNDLRTHTIIKDRERNPLILRLFQAYATGEHTFVTIQTLANSIGLTTRREAPLSHTEVERILKNPMYYGMFLYQGELHQGVHEPTVSKQLFDQVQRAILQHGKPRGRRITRPFLFRGFFACGECSCCVTVENHIKKSGLSFTYYRCTKKRGPCRQGYINEFELRRQVDAYIQKVALSDEWADKMLEELEKERQETAHSSASLARDLQGELAQVEAKMDRLLTAHLAGALELPEYQGKKKVLLEKKVGLKERIANLAQGTDGWLEPMRKWILSSKNAKNLASWDEKRDFFRTIGSNFILAGGRARFSVKKQFNLLYFRTSKTVWRGRRDLNPRSLP